MKSNVVNELKGLPKDESVYVTLNVNNITEIRPQKGNLFNKNVSFEVYKFSDYAELETELIVSELLDLLEKKELEDYVSADFDKFSINTTGPGDKEYKNILWELPLTESENIEIANLDLEMDSNSEQIENTKVSFERDSVTSIKIVCESGYTETLEI